MNYRTWPEVPIPANASATGKFRHPNGIYALYYPDGSLRFLCRLVSAQVQCWLNLSADGLSGHFDDGNTGEAYYKDGRMETFSPWDDSPPFRPRFPLRSGAPGPCTRFLGPFPRMPPSP